MSLFWVILSISPWLLDSTCPKGFTQMRTNPNKCYSYIYEQYMTAEQAVSRCSNLGTTLLSVDSKEENNELKSKKIFDKCIRQRTYGLCNRLLHSAKLSDKRIWQLARYVTP